MFANEAKLLNEVLPANPLLNQLLQFLPTGKRQTMTVQQLARSKPIILSRWALQIQLLLCVSSLNPTAVPLKSLLNHHLPFTEPFPTVLLFLHHTYFL